MTFFEFFILWSHGASAAEDRRWVATGLPEVLFSRAWMFKLRNEYGGGPPPTGAKELIPMGFSVGGRMMEAGQTAVV